MIHPFRSLMLLIGVSGLLFVLSLLVGKEMYFFGHTIKVFSFEDGVIHKKEPKADISHVLEMVDQVPVVDHDTVLTFVRKPLPELDSIELDSQYRIQYPDSSREALAGFFKALDYLVADSSLIRVLHFGDSQIEGDRITQFLRRKLQQQFGGCGIGMVPIVSTVPRPSITQKQDPLWIKHAMYGKDYKPATLNNYGVLGSYFSFSPQYLSLKSDSLKEVVRKIYSKDTLSGWVTYSTSYKSPSFNRHFERFTLYYGKNVDPCRVKITIGKDTVVQQTIQSNVTLNQLVVPNSSPFSYVNLQAEGSTSPPFYGASFDCGYGVAVDNISLRGSSGLEFSRFKASMLEEQLKALNTKFIIVQFGVNVVPGELESYSFYEIGFYRQLKLLKKLLPGVSILVIGVSDMSKKVDEAYVSYNNIVKIRDAQRRAAFRAGCAFWDLYAAMGGENSMVSWVEAKPALAGKDYTHFTEKGASFVAEMMYKALIYAYAEYRETHP